jgi:hypothetical protein
LNIKDSTLFIEMFDSDLEMLSQSLPEALPEVVIPEPRTPGAANGLIRRLMYTDLLEKTFGESPVIPPLVPDPGRPVKPDSPRRRKLRQMITGSGIAPSGYSQEAVEGLVSAMEAYLADQIGSVRSV